jgi:hypothetical protein
LMPILLVIRMLKGIVAMNLRITVALYLGPRANFLFQAHMALFFNYFKVPNSRKKVMHKLSRRNGGTCISKGNSRLLLSRGVNCLGS